MALEKDRKKERRMAEMGIKGCAIMLISLPGKTAQAAAPNWQEWEQREERKVRRRKKASLWFLSFPPEDEGMLRKRTSLLGLVSSEQETHYLHQTATSWVIKDI